jgi:hypothetical protein
MVVAYFKIPRDILSLKPGSFYYETYAMSIRQEERNAPGGTAQYETFMGNTADGVCVK